MEELLQVMDGTNKSLIAFRDALHELHKSQLEVMDKLAKKDIEPIGNKPEEDSEQQFGTRLVWFIPRNKEIKTTKNK
mgnify:CR=1 FL=1